MAGAEDRGDHDDLAAGSGSETLGFFRAGVKRRAAKKARLRGAAATAAEAPPPPPPSDPAVAAAAALPLSALVARLERRHAKCQQQWNGIHLHWQSMDTLGWQVEEGCWQKKFIINFIKISCVLNRMDGDGGMQ